MIMRKPQYRRFEYTPRYYDPKKDEDERRRRRFNFHSNVRRGKNRPLIIIAVLFAIVYVLYLFMS